MQPTDTTGDWVAFEKDVKAEGLTHMAGYMSLPSPADLGTVIERRTWNQGDQDLLNEKIGKTETAMRTLTGHAPVVHMRPMQPSSSMQVSGTGEVKAGTTVL